MTNNTACVDVTTLHTKCTAFKSAHLRTPLVCGALLEVPQALIKHPNEKLSFCLCEVCILKTHPEKRLPCAVQVFERVGDT